MNAKTEIGSSAKQTLEIKNRQLKAELLARKQPYNKATKNNFFAISRKRRRAEKLAPGCPL